MAINYDDLSELQLRAFDIAIESDKKATRIVGYAGTGKTTVMAEVAKHFGKECVVLAPTNKAASVLREKGVASARTIHSCLYQPYEVEIFQEDASGEVVLDKDGEPILLRKEVQFELKASDDSLLPPIALVDESSMVNEVIYDDLLYAFDKVIFFGDAFQLPPVGNTKGALDLGEFDIEMRDVHRVALDNPITRYATDIRNGVEPNINDILSHEIKWCKSSNTKLYKSIIDNDIQCICHRNATRHLINENIRRAKGFKPNTLLPEEPIISLSNIRRYIMDEEGREKKTLIMYNGEISHQDKEFEDKGRSMYASESLQVSGVDKLIKSWPFWNEGFFEQRAGDRWERGKKQARIDGVLNHGYDFDYAYCLTAHKAQGSEFKNVAVFDQRSSMRGDKQRWFYTAITRAKERLLIIHGI